MGGIKIETVVITGGDGFIGSHLVRYFSEHGTKVYALTLPGSSTVSRVKDIPNVVVVQKELTQVEALAEVLPRSPIAFIHLAWNGVSPENRNSIECQTINIDLCLCAVRLAAKIEAQRFILPGSTAEYAYCGQIINEKACPSPGNAYGAVKISVRYLCQSLCKDLELPYIYVVSTGIYAADRRDGNVIYYTISELIQGRKPSLTALEQQWDYVYIDDVEDAFYRIAQRGKPGAFYGIGHGDNWPLSNYIRQIRDCIDPTLPLGIGDLPYASTQLPSSCVDMTSLQEDTGYIPRVSFEFGIKKVIEKMKEQMSQGSA